MSDSDNQGAPQTWIFQAVPDKFDLATALKHIRVFRWRVKQRESEIHAGDDVYLWLAGDGGGIVARGTILTDPQLMADAPEERPFELETSDEAKQLCVAIEINTIFDEPLSKSLLLEHPLVKSLLILRNPRGTNFPVTLAESEALDLLCPHSLAGWPSAIDELADAFAKFRNDESEQLRVHLRRSRAIQIREYLTNVSDIGLDAFNQNVWAFESSTLLNGEDIKKQIFSINVLAPEFREAVREGLSTGALELHGNYCWRSGSSVYGSGRKTATDEEKLEDLHKALQVLNDSQLTPAEKASELLNVPGIKGTNATGLVMLFHPQEFAIWDQQSIGAFGKLGVAADDISTFQTSVATLRDELGADDFLELDWFLYRINQNQIQIVVLANRDEMLREIENEIESNIHSSSSSDKTEKEQLVKSRVGQGRFRLNVQLFENKCRVTGVSDPQFLIASHIKPWRSSNNIERLDGENGLFLSPNIDALFDKGKISFDDDGTLLLSSNMDADTLKLLGVPDKPFRSGAFTKKQKKYLAHHRHQFGF